MPPEDKNPSPESPNTPPTGTPPPVAEQPATPPPAAPVSEAVTPDTNAPEAPPPPVVPAAAAAVPARESTPPPLGNHMLKKLLLVLGGFLVLVAALSAFFVFSKASKAPEQVTVTAVKKPVIKIAVNPWKASELNAEIAKILLEEKMGYKVTLVPVDEYKMWPQLASGSLDAALEVWPSGHKDDMQKYIKTDKTVEDGGLLGPVGKIGWYIPKYLAESNPDLTTWQGFKDPKNTALFATGSAAMGEFYTGDPTWTQYDDQIIKNLQLPFHVVTLGSEDALLKKVDENYKAKKPIVFYLWTPHWAHAVYDLVPVTLPEYTDACYKDLKSGVNCDYPKDPLKKAFSSKLQSSAPNAYQFLSKFKYTNEDQIRMLASLQLKKQSTEEVARNWINNNESVWQLWISN